MTKPARQLPAAVLPAVPAPVRAVADRLHRAGFAAYLVGGAVRDLLMAREPRDLDIVTDARPHEVAALFPGAVMVGAAFGVVRVREAGAEVDVATFRREGPYLDGRRPAFVEFATLEQDVRRRDFTVNALLLDLHTGAVVDLVGGGADLQARRIRAVGDAVERFAEDRLRMLRAVRLAAELGFTIEAATLEAIRRHAPAITQVSAERLRDELLRLLVAPGRARGVRLLQESGLLAPLLPEVAATVGVPQPPEYHPEGDVFTHTVLTLHHLEEPTPVLALAALLHDVGKPPTLERADRLRFPDHDVVGAALAERVCLRLRLGGAVTARVVTLVRDHLRLQDVPRMRPGRAKRFLAREDLPDLLALHRADVLASHGDLTTYRWVQEAAARLTEEERRLPRLLTGDDLIALGYRPGPRFRVILEAVEEAQLEGRVRTRAEAEALVRTRFPQGAGGEGRPGSEVSSP
jgi:poly(A) polymerase